METTGTLDSGILAALVVLYAALLALFVWAYVRIIQKAGYSGWWVLMGLVPIGNLVMLCLFAFKEWPIRRELQYLRGYAAATGLPGYAPQPPYGSGPGISPPGSAGPGPDVPGPSVT